jgi:hypothetical protein
MSGHERHSCFSIEGTSFFPKVEEDKDSVLYPRTEAQRKPKGSRRVSSWLAYLVQWYEALPRLHLHTYE